MPAETHVERNPIGPDDVLAVIRERLAEILEIDEDRITRARTSPTTSTPTRWRSSSWSRRSSRSWASAPSGSPSTTKTSPISTPWATRSTT